MGQQKVPHLDWNLDWHWVLQKGQLMGQNWDWHWVLQKGQLMGQN
jgi:hypothetical protein